MPTNDRKVLIDLCDVKLDAVNLYIYIILIKSINIIE